MASLTDKTEQPAEKTEQWRRTFLSAEIATGVQSGMSEVLWLRPEGGGLDHTQSATEQKWPF